MAIAHLVLLGTLTVTAYRPIPAQTKPECIGRFGCTTSIGENVSEAGIAVSQDLLRSGVVHYRDCLYIPGIGFRMVTDTMAPRHRNSIDIFVYTLKEEKAMGVKRKAVYKVIVQENPFHVATY